MGAALSSSAAKVKDPEVRNHWLLHYADSAIKYASYASLESFTKDGVKLLALAFQASDAGHVCSKNQHLRFALSKDGGDTWTPTRVVMWGLGPVWAPILWYDASTARLFLFYSESRKAFSPGGDIKCMFSTDAGVSWTPPVTIYTHEADGEVPKIAVNRPAVDSAGVWYLGIHREPARSFESFNTDTFCSMKEAGAAVPLVPTPTTALPQGVVTSAGVLISRDRGATWQVGGIIEDPAAWLIEPAIECTDTHGLLAMLRSSAGKMFISRSVDGGLTWSTPTASSLPNPNSKFSSVNIDGQILLAYNDSAALRTPLVLGLTVDAGQTWETLAAIETDPAQNYSCPSMVHWSSDTVKMAYTVWGFGIKLASVRLDTEEV